MRRYGEPTAANENLLVSELQFLCAHTNVTIPTGVWTDHHALLIAKERSCVMPIRCPNCGMTHTLSMNDAVLNRTLRWEDGVGVEVIDSLPVVDTRNAILASSHLASEHTEAGVRIAAHQRNIMRYRKLLDGHLRPMERDFARRQIAKELSGLRELLI